MALTRKIKGMDLGVERFDPPLQTRHFGIVCFLIRTIENKVRFDSNSSGRQSKNVS